MGIDLTNLRALLLARKVAPDNFSNIATLGRQEIFFTEAEFEQTLNDFAISTSYSPDYAYGSFQEPLLTALGARSIASIDASSYEGATLLCDFNQPVPIDMRLRYSMFVDFGSMEHIFDVKQVLQNMQRVLTVNGTLLIVTNANGETGHGFFQFSPELFYNYFSERAGFKGTRVFLVDQDAPYRWYSIRSPAQLSTRNIIPSDRRMSVICLSTKDRDVDLEQYSIQQSDYSQLAWQTTGHRHSITASRSGLKAALYKLSPATFHLLKRRRRLIHDRSVFASQTTIEQPSKISLFG